MEFDINDWDELTAAELWGMSRYMDFQIGQLEDTVRELMENKLAVVARYHELRGFVAENWTPEYDWATNAPPFSLFEGYNIEAEVKIRVEEAFYQVGFGSATGLIFDGVTTQKGVLFLNTTMPDGTHMHREPIQPIDTLQQRLVDYLTCSMDNARESEKQDD